MGLFAARKMAVEEHNKNAHSPFRRTVSVFADMVRAQLKRCTTSKIFILLSKLLSKRDILTFHHNCKKIFRGAKFLTFAILAMVGSLIAVDYGGGHRQAHRTDPEEP